MNGEHAQGLFYVPMATTEGSLVASYNRGMRLLAECGGVKTTVIDDCMQRAPAFVFGDAREARDFGQWVKENFAAIKREAEATTSVGRLRDIAQFAVGPLRYLRFNYTTGDAAGQNMAGKGDFCGVRVDQEELSGSVAVFPERKSGHRQKTFAYQHVAHPRQTRRRGSGGQARSFQSVMHVDTAEFLWARQVQMTGAFLAGSSNNGAHAANGLAALFIATGQDVANIAESHAALTYSQLVNGGDFYWSITLPSLIVATYGGGTGLATQKQCLEMLGCYGKGKVEKVCGDLRSRGAGGRNLAGRSHVARRLGFGPREAGTQSSLVLKRGRHAAITKGRTSFLGRCCVSLPRARGHTAECCLTFYL